MDCIGVLDGPRVDDGPGREGVICCIDVRYIGHRSGATYH